jgi:hypothetical protein
MLHDGRGLARYGHTGSWQGFRTAYLHVVDADLSVIALGNLREGDPMRTVERVAQILVPDLLGSALATPTLPDPELVVRVRALLEATQSGTLRETEFEFVRPGFFPAVPLTYKKLLDKCSPVERIELLEKWELGDDTVLRLRAVAGRKPLLITLSITPAGKFSSYRLQVE